MWVSADFLVKGSQVKVEGLSTVVCLPEMIRIEAHAKGRWGPLESGYGICS